MIEELRGKAITEDERCSPAVACQSMSDSRLGMIRLDVTFSAREERRFASPTDGLIYPRVSR